MREKFSGVFPFIFVNYQEVNYMNQIRRYKNISGLVQILPNGVVVENNATVDINEKMMQGVSVLLFQDQGQVSSVYDSPVGNLSEEMKQGLKNGNFDTWTLETSKDPADTTEVATKWKVKYAADSGTFPQFDHSKIFATDKLAKSKYLYQLNIGGAGSSLGDGSYYQIVQEIINGYLEKVNGQELTLSLHALSNITDKKLGVYLSAYYAQLGIINDVAIDTDGNLYVLDSTNKCVQVFNSDGEYVTSFGSTGTGDGEFDTPWGIAVNSDGEIYVADSGNDRIQKFTSAYVFDSKFGSTGSGNGELSGPRGLTVDADDNVYVCDAGNNRIQKFVSDTYDSQFGTVGTGDGQLNSPSGISIASDGTIFVSDTGNNRLQKFTSAGVYSAKVGAAGTGNGQFNTPLGVWVDKENSDVAYVCDSVNRRLQKFTSACVFFAVTLTKYITSYVNGTAFDLEDDFTSAPYSYTFQLPQIKNLFYSTDNKLSVILVIQSGVTNAPYVDETAAVTLGAGYIQLGQIQLSLGNEVLEFSPEDEWDESLENQVTPTELSYLSGLTSNVQTQLNSLSPSLTTVEVTDTSASLAVNKKYIANNGSLVTLTLPATAVLGSEIEVIGKGSGGWKIAQNASQSINFANGTSTPGTGGYIASQAQYDTVKLICTIANTTWTVVNAIGALTVI